MLGQPAFGLDRSHASRPCSRYGLPVGRIGNISARVHAFDRRLRRSWFDLDVASIVEIELVDKQAGVRLVTNRDERVQRLLSYLADRLEEIFEEDEGSAIGRHSAGK